MKPKIEETQPAAAPAAAADAPEAEGLAEDLQELQHEAAQIDASVSPAAAAAQQQQAAAANQQEAEWAALVVGLGAPVAQILAPNWQIQRAELEALGNAWAPILQQYFPDGPGSMGPWPGAILCTAMVVGPRIGVPRHLPKPEQGNASQPATGQVQEAG